MPLRSKLAVLALVLAGVGPCLPAQQNPCLTRTIAVNVTTADGTLVKGLTAANFRAKFRRRPVNIVSATYDTGPRRVVILLDTSGSMRDNWNAETKVAERLVAVSPPQVSFALLTFAERIEGRIGFYENREPVMDGLQKLRAARGSDFFGRTALLDAVLEALSMFKQPQTGDAIYLITDGGDNHSRAKDSEVRRAAVSTGVRMFSFLPVEALSNLTRTPEENGGPELISALVEATGGEEATVERPVRHSIVPAREIAEFYRLELKLPGPVDKPRDWKLEVIDPVTGKANSKLRVIYPRKLAPCP